MPETMYRTCLACGSRLARNDALEHLRVGRRVAFDSHRGRLWVVCQRCERWNLVPFDARWEAIEECAVATESAPIRASTEEITLARHPSGLELVRVGRPARLELASWRWSDRFTARRRRRKTWQAVATGTVVAGGVGAAAVGGAGAVLIGLGMASYLVPTLAAVWSTGAPGVRLSDGDEQRPPRLLTMEQVRGSVLRAASDTQEWELAIPPADFRGEPWVLKGLEARRAAPKLLTRLNRRGAAARTVVDAVREIESGGRESYVRRVAAGSPHWKGLHNHAPPVVLALEMALREESEERALAGDLVELEAAWREAEELAAISDALLIDTRVEGRLQALRREAQSDLAEAEGPEDSASEFRSPTDRDP